MSVKVQRILLTIILSIISIPVLVRLIVWILLPGNYDSDGGSDFSYGLIIFYAILPPIWIFTSLLIWHLIEKHYKRGKLT